MNKVFCAVRSKFLVNNRQLAKNDNVGRVFLIIFTFSFSTTAIVFITACAPKIYLIDRQTVFEQEAAGEWPDFEREIYGNSIVSSPIAFPSTPITARKQRLYNVLNGELVGRVDPTQAPVKDVVAPSRKESLSPKTKQ